MGRLAGYLSPYEMAQRESIYINATVRSNKRHGKGHRS